MYQQYFGLTESPFSIAPDPRYLFLSNKHREALAHLLYGVGDQGGFVVLTGEVGTGKTTICRCLLQQVPDNADIAFIINPKQSINQLLQSICNDLSVSYDKGITSKDLIDLLNQYLLSAHSRGRNTILLIDEAQNLSVDVLEQLRLLTNLETNEKKLLQLVLLGQPELNDLLAKSELRQLAQRVTARYHLSPLSKAEVSEYIQHRLSVAGCRSQLFTTKAINKIFKLSKGVPRLINLICDRTLLGVYATSSAQADAKIVSKAAKEIFLPSTPSRWKPVWFALFMAIALLLSVFIWKDQLQQQVSRSPITTEISPASEPSTITPPIEISPLNSSIDIAFLYQLWGLPDKTPLASCDNSLITEELYCLTAINSLDEVFNFNVPAALQLQNTLGEVVNGILQSITNQQAYFVSSSGAFNVSLDELKKYSFKNAILLSRLHPDLLLPIQPGDHNNMIGWLQNTLLFDESAVTAKPMVDSVDVSNVKSTKMAIFYKHYLHFDSLDNKAEYEPQLVNTVTRLQKQLGQPPTGIIDFRLLTALTQKRYQSDPVLFKLTEEAG